NYVNHEWVTSKKTREIINPFNGDPIAIVPEASKKDVDEAVAAAREAFDRGPWRDFTAQQRGRILFAMADIVRKNAAMLADPETFRGDPDDDARIGTAGSGKHSGLAERRAQRRDRRRSDSRPCHCRIDAGR